MPSTASLALLVVDDDARIRELLEVAVRRTSAFGSVVFAQDGAAALQTLRSGDHQVDVVLTDLSMPVMDGLEMVRQLRSDPQSREIPVIMFSSSNRPNDRDEALSAGCCAFFEKPANLTGLEALLGRLPAIARDCAKLAQV